MRNFVARRALRSWLGWLLCLAPLLTWAGPPVKLVVDQPHSEIWSGLSNTIRLRLLDANNQPAAAPRDWRVQLHYAAPDGSVRNDMLLLPTGTQSADFHFTPDLAGVWEISATHPELRDAMVMLSARERSERHSPTPSGGASGTRGSGGVGGPGFDLGEILPPSPTPVPAPVTTSERPRVELRAAPRRKLLADGKDEATIYSLLSGAQSGAPQDITVRLLNDDGNLSPSEVVIPQGQFSGATRLTSEHVGTVTVEFLGSAPAVQMLGDPRLHVAFGAPITGLELTASPPRINFFEHAELVVRLLNPQGTPVAADELREVFITLEGGGGQLERGNLSFAVGDAEQRLRFSPTRGGVVALAAASPDLLTVRTAITVEWPLAALLASAVGGLLGGLLAFWLEKGQWWRIAMGLVTGFMLYWAAVFAGLEWVSPALALNPLSAVAISIIGGWLGAKVFAPLLKRLGVPG